MKCSVCGNELNSNSTKCPVCGTTNNSNLRNAISNISSLANALKTKRENQVETKSTDKEIKKVNSLDEDMEALYTKDLSFEPDESEVTDDFDLNAFYEKAKHIKEKVEEPEEEEEIEEGEIEEEEAVEKIDASKQPEEEEELEEKVDVIEQLEKEDEPVELKSAEKVDSLPEEAVEESLDKSDNNQDNDDFDINSFAKTNPSLETKETIADKDLVNTEIADDDIIKPTVEKSIVANDAAEPVVEDVIKPTVEEKVASNDIKDESVDLIQPTVEGNIQPDATVNNNVEEIRPTIEDPKLSETVTAEEDIIKPTMFSNNTGYIKEEDIVTAPESVQEQPTDEVKQEQTSQSEDNSPIVDLEIPEVGKSAEPPKEEQKKEESFESVKPEDVPYTQLEEKKDSKVNESNPIKIDEKDVVNPDNRDNSVIVDDNEDNKPAKSGGNKFFGVMSCIVLIATILAFGVVMLYLFVIKDSETTNAVFDIIKEFVPNNLMWCIVGSLAGAVVSFLFGIFQILAKPRKMGKILVILSILVAGGMCAGYYFTDNLLPAIDFVKTLLGV